MEETTINDRLVALTQHLTEGNAKKFAESIGIKPGTFDHYVGKNKSKPGYEIISRICEVYPRINERWILLGEGPMMKEGALTASQGSGIIYGNKNRKNVVGSGNTLAEIDAEKIRLETEVRLLREQNNELKKEKQDLLSMLLKRGEGS